MCVVCVRACVCVCVCANVINEYGQCDRCVEEGWLSLLASYNNKVELGLLGTLAELSKHCEDRIL